MSVPVAFPCRHPACGPVPGLPMRYDGERFCPECKMLVSVEIAVHGTGTIGYRCGQGHMWLAGKVARSA